MIFFYSHVSTQYPPNFVNKHPFLINLAPLKSPVQDLFNGAKFIEIGFLSRKLWTFKVDMPNLWKMLFIIYLW